MPTKNPPGLPAGGSVCAGRCGGGRAPAPYFCQVRFLWRLALRRFRRLCFDIFRRRFFLRFPMRGTCERASGVSSPIFTPNALH